MMRISGLASGLDIDSMVSKLMEAERIPLNRLNQKKTTMEWQREQYRDLNIKIVDFRNNKLFNYGMSNSISARKATITGNTSAVTAKATSSAVTGSMTVDVDSLATSAYLRSGAAGTDGIGVVDTNKSLADLKTAGKLNYTADGSGNISFKLTNGSAPEATITVNENDSLASVVAAINGSSANVNAFLDSATGKLSLTSKTTGAGTLAVTGDAGGLLSNFDLTNSQAGADAQLTINGIATTRSSNTFTENGIDFTLNAKTNGTASTVTVGTDTDKIVDTIKSFIKDYNDIMDSVNTKLNEEKYRNYAPLTSEQKEEMKDSEVELWEEKAKSGLLRRDSTLTSMVDNMRLASITNVKINGEEVNMAAFGIGTGKWYEKGKLVIEDEDKLREAIENDPDKVIALFTQQTAETDPDKKKSATNPDNGLFNRLSNVLATALEELSKKVGTLQYSTDKSASFNPSSTMGEEMRLLDMKISDMTSMLALKENNYYKKFTAMETAMNRYNAQSTSLFNS